jgi:hypothetical protein
VVGHLGGASAHDRLTRGSPCYPSHGAGFHCGVAELPGRKTAALLAKDDAKSHEMAQLVRKDVANTATRAI